MFGKSVIATVVLLSVVGQYSLAQSQRHLLMEGTGEYGWSVRRPSPISGEAEGRVLALDAVNSRIEAMANIRDFEQFSNKDVTTTLQNKYEQIGKVIRNTTTITRAEKQSEAFRANKRGLVITIEESGFKPGTFSSFYKRDKFTGVRSSGASGILLYKFKVYAPEGYDPNGGIGQPNSPSQTPLGQSVARLPDGSRFVKDRTGGTWTEYHPDGRVKVVFRELNKDSRFVSLRDETRRLTLKLPLAGGRVQWQYDGQRVQDWNTITWQNR